MASSAYISGRGRQRLACGHVRRVSDRNLRGIHKSGTDTASVLTRLNERLLQRPSPDVFARRCTRSSSSHARTHLLQCRHAASHARLRSWLPALGRGGLPSGMFADAPYERNVVQLRPGDSVLFASDGLHESLNPEGVEFAPLKWQWCGRNAGANRQRVRGFCLLTPVSFSSGIAPHDDITAVVLKVLP